ncbi:MAG: PAS domain-containing protein, partial [Candidatus Competibacteraceae bacterium]|nr:PAS domain-containing protein [Candidatus Competibacteraceae bacterium]
MAGRIKLWLVIQVLLVMGLLIGSLAVALSYGGAGAEGARGPLMLFALFGSLGFVVVTVFFWRILVRGLLRPLEVVAREVRTLTQSKQLDRPLRVPEGQRLGELPEAVEGMIDELRRSRREAVRAMATATARVEQEKGWLEMILLELVPNGVVVCSLDHRILLYNRPAGRLFHFSHALGLGRSLFDLVAGEPVRHALERLQYRLHRVWQDVGPPFVCASRDARLMFKARIALILDQDRRPTGYVLSLEDLSAQLVELQRSAARQRAVTRDMRGPLGSLRAAAENLAAFPDLDQQHRQVFQQIVLNETTVLSQQIEKLTLAWADSSASRSGERWLMAEIHSPDLFGCVVRQLEEEQDLQVTVAGEPHWLKGDSYSLVQVLVQLIKRLRQRQGNEDFTLEAGLGQSRAYLELRWQGKPVASSELNGWLDTPLPALSGLTALDVLE